MGRLWREALVVTGAGAEELRKKASPLVDVRLILPRSKSNPSALLGTVCVRVACRSCVSCCESFVVARA